MDPRKRSKGTGLVLAVFLLTSTILSVWVIPLPIAKAAPASSWATFTIAASGDDVVTLANSTWSNYTTNGNNLWVHSNEYTTITWLRFEGLGAITNAGGVIDQIILSMYSGDDVGADYTGESSSGGYVSVSAPLYSWDWELSEINIANAQMNPIASFDGDELSPSGAWYNKTISTSDPRDWYSWTSTFNDVFTCYVGGFMQYSPDYKYYRGFTSQDEGHPAKLYVKYHTGEGYEEVLEEFEVSSATYVQTWNNYNFWYVDITDKNRTGEGYDVNWNLLNVTQLTEIDSGSAMTLNNDTWVTVVDYQNLAIGCFYNDTGYADIETFFLRFKINVTDVESFSGGNVPASGVAGLSSSTPVDGVGLSYGISGDWVGIICQLNPDDERYRFYVYERSGGSAPPGDGYSPWFTEVTQGMLYLEVRINCSGATKWISYDVYDDPGFTNSINYDLVILDYAEGPFRYPQIIPSLSGATGAHTISHEFYTYLEMPLALDVGYIATAPNGTVITPDPFDDLDDCIDFVKEWDESYGPVLSISIANIDAVEWVFEGKKRYEFTVVYINVNLTDIEQVGVGFTDEINNFHSVWYDRDANTLTVTSPEDAISGWLHSIEQTGINVTAVFHIMFNSPIPDSYDVSAYGRIVDTSDSGWVTPRWGESDLSGELYLFNIYNLGGLSTLTASGTAGRMTGGDVFELYAADTRTNIAGTQYFDVRDAPLSWYNVLTNEDLLINEMPPEWKFNIPRREEATTIRLTNNLPQDRVGRDYGTPGTDDMAYVSYPFSMRLLSDPYLTGVYQVGAELEFPRTLTTDDEILTVQAYLMTPNASQTTGAFRIRDESRLIGGSKLLADVQFTGNGSWASYNSTLADWHFYGNYTAHTWYNVTIAVNLTGAVYDVYIDDELKFSDMPYRSQGPAATTALIVEFTQFVNPYGSEDYFLDLYVDNVRQWTSFDADYGGIAKATTLFKQLQHWSMDFDFFIENGEEYAQGPSATTTISEDDYSDYGYIELGWDVMINETWVNDFLVARVNITDGRIAGKNDWVKFNVTWYSQSSYVKNDMLYGLFEGYSLFPGSAKDTTGFHWDMWFNRANASTVIGARINTEYFGMSDKSVWWAVWSSKWQPMRTEVSDSTIFVNLQNAGLVTQSVKDVLFVRSWVEVYRNSESTFAYKILNIDGLDFLVAIETMSGIDTPPVRETKVPDIVSGFLGSALGSIFSAALKRLGNAMAGFGMDFFTLSIDFMDNVFAALGYPALVSTIFGWMDSLFASIPELVGYGITLIGQIFLLINTSAGNTLTQLTSIITIWVGMYSTTMDLLNGVLTPGLNLWNDLGISSFIQIGAILYPFWLIMMGMEKGTQAVFDHLNSVLNIGSFFLNFILNVGGFFMGLMDMLIGAIRG